MPRAQAPTKLTPDQAEIWLAYTNRMPADYFGREHYDELTQLCREVSLADRIDAAIQVETDAGLLLKLSAQQNKQSTVIDRLLRSMRLTHQANVRAERSYIPTIEAKPLWENY